ncbi:MAG: NADPH-dependent F420 reductase [Pseudomonadota bacterium]
MKILYACFIACLLTGNAVADEQPHYTIGIIGTGNMGSALGVGLTQNGHTVVYGSREPSSDKAQGVAEATGGGAVVVSQAEAARRADIVILAVPWFAVEALMPSLGDLSGKILVDVTTGDVQGEDGYPTLGVETSTSEMIRDWSPGVRVVKTPFSAAAMIREPMKHGEPTMTYLASDDRDAKEIIARLSIQLGFFPLDAGPLRMAKTIDHLGMLYLTPMMQGRNHTWVWLPRVDFDLSCVDTEGWFEPVVDRDNLARFPNLDDVVSECPGRE